MARYALVKILLAVPSALAVVVLVFFLMRVLPGDVALSVLGDQATAEAIAAFRHNAGLDQPVAAQFASYMVALAHGDLGTSLKTSRSIAEMYGQVLPYTIDLVVASLALAICVGVFLGAVAAARAGSVSDALIRLFSSATIAMPVFYLGIILLIVFALALKLMPAIGGGDLSNVGSRLSHLVLPAATISLLFAGRIARMTRTALAEVLSLDYIRTAHAKGLREGRVIRGHALRNGLIAITTVIGVYFASATAGSIIVETVFNRPGVGRVLIGGIADRDYTVVQSGLLLYSLLVVFINLVVDLLIFVIDPRLRTRSD